MYRFTRTTTAKPGQLQGAIAFAQELAGHITANHGVEVKTAVEVFGNVSGISWHSDIESLAEWEQLNMKMIADETLQEKIRTHAPQFLVEGSTHDKLVMFIPSV